MTNSERNRMIMQNRVYSLIGLSMKAGKIESGEFMAEKSVKEKKAALVIVAEDASDNTKKLFRNKCAFYQVPCCVYGTKEMLGKSIGREIRAVVAVMDKGLAGKIKEEIGKLNI